MSRNKRRQPLSPWSLGSIPLTPVVDKPRETLWSFTEAYNREEARKKDEQLTAPIRKVEAELHAETLDISRRVKAFFSLDLHEMAGYPVSGAPTDVATLVGTFPTRHTPRNQSEEADIYREFRKGLEADGTRISDEGFRRLGSWVSAQIANGDIEPSTALWQHGLDRLTSLGCFKPGESNYEIPAPVEQPIEQPKPGLDELLRATSAESRSGRTILLDAVHREATSEREQAIYQFLDECRELFGGREFTQSEKDSIARVMDARNFQSTSVKDWHRARVLATQNGSVRETFRTRDEQLSIDVDKGRFDFDSFSGRQKFNRAVAELQQSKK